MSASACSAVLLSKGLSWRRAARRMGRIGGCWHRVGERREMNMETQHFCGGRARAARVKWQKSGYHTTLGPEFVRYSEVRYTEIIIFLYYGTTFCSTCFLGGFIRPHLVCIKLPDWSTSGMLYLVDPAAMGNRFCMQYPAFEGIETASY